MNNIEYITHKITMYGDINSSIEEIARIYFKALGFDTYICSEQLYHNDFVKKDDIFEELVKHANKYETGIPDLVLIKDNNITFVEVKRINGNSKDSLSQNQLLWIQNHPQYKVIIFGLEICNEDSSNIKIKELEQQINNLKNEITQLKRDLDKKWDIENYKIELEINRKVLTILQNISQEEQHKQIIILHRLEEKHDDEINKSGVN